MSCDLLQDGTHVKRLERLCDAVVRLEAFAGSDKEQNPLYKDYHGESRAGFKWHVHNCSVETQ